MAKDGVKVGKYTIHEKLGTGGFGVVRRGVNEENGTVVAIKILDKAELQLNEMTQHIKKEITLLTTLHHPNIVRGLDVLNSRTKIFLVMEFVGGGDLHSVLTARKRFTENEARSLFRSLVESLAYCHEKGVFHRDLKLENLLLTSSGQLKVCDFGLASVRALNSQNADLCKTIVGTEDFSPPEILQNIPYHGDKADMWSAGIILYIMIAGYSPFSGRNPRDLIQKIVSCKYSFPQAFPEGPKNIVSMLLLSKPKERASAAELLAHQWLEENSASDFSTGNLDATSPVSVPSRSPSELDSSVSTHQLSMGNGPKSQVTAFKSSHKSLKSAREYSLRSLPQSWRESSESLLKTSGLTKRPRSLCSGTKGHVLYEALCRANIPNYDTMFQAMREPIHGFQVHDRRWRLKTFPKCFIGSEAVQWIADHLSCPSHMAVVIGNRFLEIGAFHHVCREHPFADSFLFYRWHSDDPENQYVLNLSNTYPRTLNPRGGETVVHELLNQLLVVCKMHQRQENGGAVDLVGVQKDELFKAFRTATEELQSVSMPALCPDEKKLSFLVNLYNLLWLQGRIHIGDVDTSDFNNLKDEAEEFEYMIGGTKVSLAEVSSTILSGMNKRTSTQISAPSKPRRHSGGIHPYSVSSLSRFFNKAPSNDKDMLEAIRPGHVDPLVHFLISEGCPNSPSVTAISEEDVTKESIARTAKKYLNSVLELDFEACSVQYPMKVKLFRESIRIAVDEQFIKVLRDLCEGTTLQSRLTELLDGSKKRSIPPIALAVDENDALSHASFAPRIGTPDFSSPFTA